MDAHPACDSAADGRAQERKWNVLNEHQGGVIFPMHLFADLYLDMQKETEDRPLSPSVFFTALRFSQC